MPAIYNGASYNPIQSFSVSQQAEFLPSGKLKKYLFNISVKGKIVPSSSLTPAERHTFIINQVLSMTSAFSVSATDTKKTFEVQSRNGSAPFKCVPRIKSLTFEPGPWVDYADYNIELESDSYSYGTLTVSSNSVPNELDDIWTIEINDEDKKFFKVIHKISAKGNDDDVQKGWEKAKAAVDSKINAVIPNDIAASSGKTLQNAHNKKKSYRLNKLNGEASADVEITYHNPIGTSTNFAVHDQTLMDKENSDSARKIFGVEGTITGLGANESTDRYSPASALWSTVKAQIEGQYSAKIILSKSESHDKTKGIINYSYEIEDYNKPNKRTSIGEMGDLANPPKLYVIHQTIYGTDGPLFQDIGTKKVHTKTVTMEIVSKEDEELDTLQYQPADSIIDSDSVQRSLTNGKQTRTTTFIWVE